MRAPRSFLLCLAAAAAVHGGIAIASAVRAEAPARAIEARTASATITDRIESDARQANVDAARRRLVEEARTARREHRLRLGDFLMRAAEIDADEAARAFDRDKVSALYAERTRDLERALDAEPLPRAIAHVFSDLRYVGIPGGAMADALLDRGGSCEQLATLVAAAAHDVHAGDRVALRFYGGIGADGVAHVTAIAKDKDGDFDLLAGAKVLPGGAQIDAEELVEIYARTHGLAPMLEAATAATGHTDEPRGAAPPKGRASLADGFPANNDVFPGALPMFAQHGIAPPSDDEEGAQAGADPIAGRARAHDCALYVRMAVLDPPQMEAETTLGDVTIEARPARAPSQLELRAMMLEGAREIAADRVSTKAERLMADACAKVLSDELALDFSLAGDRTLAARAMTTSKEAREAGDKELASIPWPSAEGARVRADLAQHFAGQTWLLLALNGGDALVLALADEAKADDWGHVEGLAALVVNPLTRARGLARVGALPMREQIDVMHEIFHAHDHARPWASNYDLGEASPGEAREALAFRALYGVFRGLAYRLWEGKRDTATTLAALRTEAKQAGLSDEDRAALFEYFARNVLGIHQNRPDGIDVVAALVTALREERSPALALLNRRLNEILARGKLDAVTLSDAWRL
jgi:hypothetical protein